VAAVARLAQPFCGKVAALRMSIVRIFGLLVMLALALPASAQDLEMRRWIQKKTEALGVQIERCLAERELGGECQPEQLLDQKRRNLRSLHPIFCEAYLDGRWVGVGAYPHAPGPNQIVDIPFDLTG
jgi:hypothetical protein